MSAPNHDLTYTEKHQPNLIEINHTFIHLEMRQKHIKISMVTHPWVMTLQVILIFGLSCNNTMCNVPVIKLKQERKDAWWEGCREIYSVNLETFTSRPGHRNTQEMREERGEADPFIGAERNHTQWPAPPTMGSEVARFSDRGRGFL